MNQNKVISTAVLFLLLGTTIPALAEKGQEQKGGGGGRAPQAQHQAQPQHAQQAQHQQSQHAQRSEPQRAQRSEPQRAQSGGYNRANNGYRGNGNNSYRGNGNNGNHYGRISDASYHDHFGHGHSFHMGRPQMIGGYNRFQYGGYWFGYNQRWPLGWGYDDDVYVDYVGGAYFMYDLRHPGIHIALNVF